MKFAGITTFVYGLRGAGAVGRASRLKSQGNLPAARLAAMAGLSLMRSPRIVRDDAQCGAVIASLTLIAEECCRADDPGASVEDIADSLQFLRSLRSELNPEQRSAIPFLEKRLLIRSSVNA